MHIYVLKFKYTEYYYIDLVHIIKTKFLTNVVQLQNGGLVLVTVTTNGKDRWQVPTRPQGLLEQEVLVYGRTGTGLFLTKYFAFMSMSILLQLSEGFI